MMWLSISRTANSIEVNDSKNILKAAAKLLIKMQLACEIRFFSILCTDTLIEDEMLLLISVKQIRVIAVDQLDESHNKYARRATKNGSEIDDRRSAKKAMTSEEENLSLHEHVPCSCILIKIYTHY